MAVPLKNVESNEPSAPGFPEPGLVAGDGAGGPAVAVAFGDGAGWGRSETLGVAAVAAGESERSEDTSLTAWRYRAAVVRHYRAVYRFAAALVRIEADAEDVTQETFTRYWQHGQTVKRPREWLFRVARNLCLDRLRRAGRVVSVETEPMAEPVDEHGPAWHYDQQELGTRLTRLVDTLPEPQRSLVVLFDIQGMSGEECARVIGLNPNQVKVYLHRARKRLRTKLEES